MKNKHNCLLFDLDGTLADTAPDMIAAINRVLAEEQRPPMDEALLRDHVSHGSKAMVLKGFGEEQPEALFEERRAKFLQQYADNLCQHTALFEGMEALLSLAEEKNIPWGIVTNKPGWLTDPLIEQMGLVPRAACIISGDTTAHAKPHPLPLLTAAEQIGVPASECIYVGDAERDIEAGNAAGMTTLIANYGYIDDSQTPSAWRADGSIDHPLQILDWLTAH